MKKKILYIIILFILLFSMILTQGISLFEKDDEKENVTVSLSYSKERYDVGSSGSITVHITLHKSKTYIYANPKGPGTGKPTKVKIKNIDDLKNNIIFSEAKYLQGERKEEEIDNTYVFVYTEETVIEIPFAISPKAAIGSYEVNIKVDYLLCSDVSCTPGSKEAAGYLIVGSSTGEESKEKDIRKEKGVSEGGYGDDGDEKGDNKKKYNKIIVTTFKKFISTLKPQPVKGKSEIKNIIQAVIFGIIAGILLNVTPCVLPVISIKILSIIQHANEDKKRIRRHGYFFAAGILIVFILLASLSAFAGYSWGSIFQNKWFLVAMICFIFTFSLSLFGVFTLPMINLRFLNKESFSSIIESEEKGVKVEQPVQSGEYISSFLKGIGATFLATPCSGPFLGGVMAWALIKPPLFIFTIFISVGVGMSLPYLVLTINTGFLRFLPKPGNWMVHFERIMGFLLLGTAIYLLNILDYTLILPVIIFIAFIALAVYLYGQIARPGLKAAKRYIIYFVSALVIAGGWFFSFTLMYDPELVKKELSLERSIWHELDIQTFMEEIEGDRTIVIDFTADWCPNCKVIEHSVLFSKEVMDIATENNLILYFADLTESDPLLESFLQKLNSRSIPFLAFFPTGKARSRPYYLRDFYTKNDFRKAVELSRR
ncbi:protein-disulfide reductase DsbD family protein [Spirochaetota bacterium]